ncbi:molybdopterin oxidoreductase family protein [Planctomyces sp. SH-PL62]|uniref:molybdopterin oxidoreductase family protein n=1 Tax=Planctomyces sp. SH-PL62 TaxID=1636152 RepID=UPI00078BDAFB|nr:nitrate reductase [Planctomyces sp. SH-PL62]AMV37428.1 Nitrate reductase [Planctomyces sp. SH-PL62]
MGETRDSIADVWGGRTPFEGVWPSRVDERTTAEPERWVASACVLCSNGCGLDVGVRDGRIVGVRGRADDRVNRGRLGPKGLHGWEANNSPDRLVRPLIRRGGRLEEATWDEAMGLVVERSREIRDRFTSGAIGFYTSGQLFLEEYYTLGVIGKAGLGTPHMDGNTRLCTATAAAALKETFGSDGQPGSYADLDATEAILHIGHNVASQQTVLWARILDRRRGPDPPRLVVIDPRSTATAKEADVHLAPRLGTNVPVLNGLIRLIIEAGQVDRDYIAAHTVGFERLEEAVRSWPPERVAEVSGVPADSLRAAAAILGGAKSLVSTVLQGVYQSMQATAAACQVNNLHLIRGMLGRPGCGLYQMNGQPTAQNTRECGADGDLPAFRNWDNPAHVDELARLWNVDPDVIPHWAPPTHAMQIFRYAETGSIKLLWISATNPAVSLPELHRIREILAEPGLFVVAQDAFATETTELADVVLPAALWGEKTGCFTNVDRTVHLAQKAVEPPGEARSDLDIFLDYARRMDFRDKDGAPLIKWSDPEGAFEAWKECTRGRPCDYTGMTYARLARGPLQWPCNDRYPDGRERLYEDGVFPTSADYCETYGHDLITGGLVRPELYRASDPGGKALIKPADYEPPHEEPDADYPFRLTTGRVVYQFHTRTKTARSRALDAAAPDAYVQIAAEDAETLGIAEGDLVEVASSRGRIRVAARIGDILPGHAFVPFHYGYWDYTDRPRAANELTLTEWDPVSKQPHFKYAAVSLAKVSIATRAGDVAGAVARGVGSAVAAVRSAAKLVEASTAGKRHVANYLGLARRSEAHLAESLRLVADRHGHEPDVLQTTRMLASWSDENGRLLEPLAERHGETSDEEPENLHAALFRGPRGGSLGLVRDLHDLWLLTQELKLAYEVLSASALALRDREMESDLAQASSRNHRQSTWLRTRIDHAAPQALNVPS